MTTQIMFDNREQREELLKALVIDDKDFTIPHHPQVWIWVFEKLKLYKFMLKMGRVIYMVYIYYDNSMKMINLK